MKTEKIEIPISDSLGTVSGEVMADGDMTFLYVFAHGAGAGLNHPFMARLSVALAALKIGTLRYNFPYMEKGGKRPDPPAIAEKTVNSVIGFAHARLPKTPLLAGGKSFGGRMTSQALSKSSKSPVKGLVFTGFPLHPAGSPGTERAKHLADISIPMLFLQGTRDALADVTLMEKVHSSLPSATLIKFEGADHSFKAGKLDLIPALAEAIKEWSSGIR
ncbi:MAG: alpha/beta family hydrolase [Cyclobacteriaceae bacterium]